jgi:cell volume regulation protein A
MVEGLLIISNEPLLYLIYVVILLICGIFASIFAKKLKIPNILFLLVVGIALGQLKYHGDHLISFPPVFITTMGLIALAMIVFDASSQFPIREFDTLAKSVFKLSFVFLSLNLILLSVATKYIFNLSIWQAIIFASLMAGTSPSVILFMFEKVKTRAIEILKIESIINTPLTVLFPIMIFEFTNKISIVGVSKFDILLEQIEPFMVVFIVGIGAGVLMGLIGSRIMKTHYVENISHLALITIALFTFALAEKLGGNGVLAVTITGLFYGNLFIKEKVRLFEFSEVFTNSMEILIFVIIGLIVRFPLTLSFIFKSLVLFGIYLIIRYISIRVAFKKTLLFKEQLFMTLNVQKGIAVAVVVFFFAGIPSLVEVLHLSIVFMLYSIVLSTVLLLFTKKLLNLKVEEEKKEVSAKI